MAPANGELELLGCIHDVNTTRWAGPRVSPPLCRNALTASLWRHVGTLSCGQNPSTTNPPPTHPRPHCQPGSGTGSQADEVLPVIVRDGLPAAATTPPTPSSHSSKTSDYADLTNPDTSPTQQLPTRHRHNHKVGIMCQTPSLIHFSEWVVEMVNGLPVFYAPRRMDREQRPRRNTVHIRLN